jgi:hypothetical protein
VSWEAYNCMRICTIEILNEVPAQLVAFLDLEYFLPPLSPPSGTSIHNYTINV